MRKSLIILYLIIIAVPMLFALPYTMSSSSTNLPNTSILPHKTASLNLAVTGSFSSDKNGSSDSGSNVVSGINFGLYEKAEVGIVINDHSNPAINLKFQIIEESQNLPQTVIGFTNVFSNIRNGNYSNSSINPAGGENDLIKNSPYIAVSKKAALLSNIKGMEYIEFKGTLGWGDRRFKGNGKIARLMNGVFFGVNLKPTEYLGLSGEFCSGSLSAGISYYSNKMSYNFGIYQAEEMLNHLMDSGTMHLAFNIEYKLDSFADEKLQPQNSPKEYYKHISSLIGKGVDLGKSPSDQNEIEKEELLLHQELQDLKNKRLEKEKELEKLKKLFEEE